MMSMNITELNIIGNTTKIRRETTFDISDKARIMYAADYIFDIIAYDTDTDTVYSFGFNYADEVLYTKEYINGESTEGMISASKALTILSNMVSIGLYEFELRESNLIELMEGI